MAIACLIKSFERRLFGRASSDISYCLRNVIFRTEKSMSPACEISSIYSPSPRDFHGGL